MDVVVTLMTIFSDLYVMQYIMTLLLMNLVGDKHVIFVGIKFSRLKTCYVPVNVFTTVIFYLDFFPACI